MLSVLIVDDEAPIRDWVEYCLKRQPERFSIVGLAKTGEEACEMAKEKNPEVIITDICMPGMSGLELMKQVKELLPYTEFIILTNYAEFSYAREAVSCGAKEYLLKSEMRAEDLISILDKIDDKKETIVNSKKEQRLPNGLIDLYGLYQVSKEEEREGFLNTLGIRKEVPYEILCTLWDKKEDKTEELARLGEKEGIKLMVPASRNEYLFLILQDERRQKLKAGALRIAEGLWGLYGHPVGLSMQSLKRTSFMACLKQASSACEYHFFDENLRIYDYEALLKGKKLNFEQVRDGYQEIQSNLTYKQYDQALKNLEGWFSMLGLMNITDSEWAMERCRRMVLMVEEQCFHLDPTGEEEAKKSPRPLTASKCRKQCVALIQKLFDKKNGTYSESIEQALSYIHENYNKDISLVDVAGVIFRSPEYFSRLFKEEVGENFSTYLMLYRLNHGKELLKKTDMKIAEISYSVGYSTQSYFSRLYKKYMGKTPEEERNQVKNR